MTTIAQEFALIAADEANARMELAIAREEVLNHARWAVASKIGFSIYPEDAGDAMEAAEMFESRMRDWPLSRMVKAA